MDYSITFARHFSRLLWLLLNESGNVDEQKAALRAIVTVSRDGPVTIATQDYRLVVNGAPLPDALTGVQDLAAQLIGHSVGEVRIQQNAAPADMLLFARALANEPTPGGAGPTVADRLEAVGAKSLVITLKALQPVVPPPPPVAPPERPSAANGVHTTEAPSRPSRRSFPATPAAEPRSAPSLSRARFREPIAEPRSAPSAVKTARRETSGGIVPTPLVHGIVTDEVSGRYLAFAAVHAPKGRVADTFAKLDETRSVSATTRALDELVALADEAGRDARAAIVADVLHGIVHREAKIDDPERKRAHAMAVRRLCKPTLLRLVAMLLPRDRERAEQYVAILARAGEDGAEALIEQLTSATSLSDRRVYFDALVKLNAGIPALIHMLGDARWYVVRNAADLLGELQATEAETPLTDAVRHDDDRVRRAAATALAKLGTPRAHHALREALRDNSAQVRMQAAIGLASLGQSRQAVTLARALDNEADEDVQLAILSSLGRVATPDAVQKLVKAAESDGRLFRKKSTTYRVSAVLALADANTPEAITALRELANDKEKEVRDAAAKALETATK